MSFNEDELYQEHILDHYEQPYHRQPCDRPTHRHEDDNPLCGDVIHIELEVDAQDKICQACFGGEGCCISQSAASMLVERMEGKSVEELKQFSAADMLALFGPKLTPNRQKCCLLAWRVMQAAIYKKV